MAKTLVIRRKRELQRGKLVDVVRGQVDYLKAYVKPQQTIELRLVVAGKVVDSIAWKSAQLPGKRALVQGRMHVTDDACDPPIPREDDLDGG